MGVGAMTDFGPLIANPVSVLLGAAAQFGIYMAYFGAMALGFSDKAAAAVLNIGKNPTLEAMRTSVKEDAEAINFLPNYTYEDLDTFIGDNINVVKYLYESIDVDMVVDILTKKVAEENVDESYLLDFIDLEVLEMNKVEFIKEYGSKRAKIILVDSMLSI